MSFSDKSPTINMIERKSSEEDMAGPVQSEDGIEQPKRATKSSWKTHRAVALGHGLGVVVVVGTGARLLPVSQQFANFGIHFLDLDEREVTTVDALCWSIPCPDSVACRKQSKKKGIGPNIKGV